MEKKEEHVCAKYMEPEHEGHIKCPECGRLWYAHRSSVSKEAGFMFRDPSIINGPLPKKKE